MSGKSFFGFSRGGGFWRKGKSTKGSRTPSEELEEPKAVGSSSGKSKVYYRKGANKGGNGHVDFQLMNHDQVMVSGSFSVFDPVVKTILKAW
jgi:hypothetical protein